MYYKNYDACLRIVTIIVTSSLRIKYNVARFSMREYRLYSEQS